MEKRKKFYHKIRADFNDLEKNRHNIHKNEVNDLKIKIQI